MLWGVKMKDIRCTQLCYINGLVLANTGRGAEMLNSFKLETGYHIKLIQRANASHGNHQLPNRTAWKQYKYI